MDAGQLPRFDFDEAPALWLDEDRVEFPARSETEVRHAMIARNDEKMGCILHDAQIHSSDYFREASPRKRREDVL